MDPFASALEQAAAVRRREVSARELVDAYLERIDRLNPRLNAFWVTTPELAREQADGVAPDGPLAGAPTSVKDLVAMAGYPLTYGSRAFEDQVAAGASAATDVTGYGLLGHLRNLRVGARVHLGRVPVLDGVRELAAADLFPGGTRRNHAAVRDEVDWGGLPEPDQLLLCDAQTSGGLLVAIAPERAAAFEAGMSGAQYPPVRIGEVTDGPVRVRP